MVENPIFATKQQAAEVCIPAQNGCEVYYWKVLLAISFGNLAYVRLSLFDDKQNAMNSLMGPISDSRVDKIKEGEVGYNLVSLMVNDRGDLIAVTNQVTAVREQRKGIGTLLFLDAFQTVPSLANHLMSSQFEALEYWVTDLSGGWSSNIALNNGFSQQGTHCAPEFMKRVSIE